MSDKPFLSTKEVAEFLDVNEKMIYALISEKGLPATKVTGKWLFPRRLVEQWLEQHIMNYPHAVQTTASQNMLIVTGSHDLLLERTLGLFNQTHPDIIAVFGSVGSLGGLRALKRGACHIAASHLLHSDEQEYNFEFVQQEFGRELAAVVNFCQREQGLIVAPGNPKQLHSVADLAQPGVVIANRPLTTGTRLLLDRELQRAGLTGMQIQGYGNEYQSHWDVAFEVLTGRAAAAPAIRSVATVMGLDFVPLRWERYDLLIAKARFFEEGVQLFLNMLQDPALRRLAHDLQGYDLSACGKMLFQQPAPPPA